MWCEIICVLIGWLCPVVKLVFPNRKCWWRWIVFVVWLSDERHLALFPAGTIVRDTDHLESLSSRIWTCAELEARLCWMKLSSSTPLHHHTTNHYSMVPQQWSMYILTCFESNLGLFAGLKAVSLSVFCSLSSLL